MRSIIVTFALSLVSISVVLGQTFVEGSFQRVGTAEEGPGFSRRNQTHVFGLDAGVWTQTSSELFYREVRGDWRSRALHQSLTFTAIQGRVISAYGIGNFFSSRVGPEDTGFLGITQDGVRWDRVALPERVKETFGVNLARNGFIVEASAEGMVLLSTDGESFVRSQTGGGELLGVTALQDFYLVLERNGTLRRRGRAGGSWTIEVGQGLRVGSFGQLTSSGRQAAVVWSSDGVFYSADQGATFAEVAVPGRIGRLISLREEGGIWWAMTEVTNRNGLSGRHDYHFYNSSNGRVWEKAGVVGNLITTPAAGVFQRRLHVVTERQGYFRSGNLRSSDDQVGVENSGTLPNPIETATVILQAEVTQQGGANPNATRAFFDVNGRITPASRMVFPESDDRTGAAFRRSVFSGLGRRLEVNTIALSDNGGSARARRSTSLDGQFRLWREYARDSYPGLTRLPVGEAIAINGRVVIKGFSRLYDRTDDLSSDEGWNRSDFQVVKNTLAVGGDTAMVAERGGQTAGGAPQARIRFSTDGVDWSTLRTFGTFDVQATSITPQEGGRARQFVVLGTTPRALVGTRTDNLRLVDTGVEGGFTEAAGGYALGADGYLYSIAPTENWRRVTAVERTLAVSSLGRRLHQVSGDPTLIFFQAGQTLFFKDGNAEWERSRLDGFPGLRFHSFARAGGRLFATALSETVMDEDLGQELLLLRSVNSGLTWDHTRPRWRGTSSALIGVGTELSVFTDRVAYTSELRGDTFRLSSSNDRRFMVPSYRSGVIGNLTVLPGGTLSHNWTLTSPAPWLGLQVPRVREQGRSIDVGLSLAADRPAGDLETTVTFRTPGQDPVTLRIVVEETDDDAGVTDAEAIVIELQEGRQDQLLTNTELLDTDVIRINVTKPGLLRMRSASNSGRRVILFNKDRISLPRDLLPDPHLRISSTDPIDERFYVTPGRYYLALEHPNRGADTRFRFDFSEVEELPRVVRVEQLSLTRYRYELQVPIESQFNIAYSETLRPGSWVRVSGAEDGQVTGDPNYRLTVDLNDAVVPIPDRAFVRMVSTQAVQR